MCDCKTRINYHVGNCRDAHCQNNVHDDVIKWEHFSALLAICLGNSTVTGEFPAQRQVARSIDVVFFIYAWMNGWVNDREADDLKRPPIMTSHQWLWNDSYRSPNPISEWRIITRDHWRSITMNDKTVINTIPSLHFTVRILVLYP